MPSGRERYWLEPSQVSNHQHTPQAFYLNPFVSIVLVQFRAIAPWNNRSGVYYLIEVDLSCLVCFMKKVSLSGKMLKAVQFVTDKAREPHKYLRSPLSHWARRGE